ncbi:MAG: PspC domain-containing protein [Candidatus Nanopelagicales bacterium]
MNENTPTNPSAPDPQDAAGFGPQPAGSSEPPGPGTTAPGGTYPPAGGYPPPPGAYAPQSATNPPTATYPTTGDYPPPSGAYAPPSVGPTSSYPPGAAPPPYGSQYGSQYGAWAPARRLTRSRSDRILGGVCGGLARYWNTDPVLVRIITVVLTIATGGAFIVGYLIAWVAIPDEPMGPPGPLGQTPSPDQAGYSSGGNPAYPGQSAQFGAPQEPKERSYLGWLILSVAILIAGVLGLISFLVPTSVATWGIIGGVALTILGIGLLVGSRYGRARWLVALAIPLSFLAFAATAAGNWVQANPDWGRWSDSDGGISVGDRTWQVTPDQVSESPLDFRLSAGEATLDLTALTALGDAEPGRPRQRVEVEAGVGLGSLRVVIPADMTLGLDATVDVGEIDLPGSDPRSGSNLHVETSLEPLTTGQPAYVVQLDVAIGVGDLEVQREAA